MEKFFEDPGFMRFINVSRFKEVERSLVDLAFVVSRWFTSSHSFAVAWVDFCSSLEGVAMLTSLPLFGNFYMVDALDFKISSRSFHLIYYDFVRGMMDLSFFLFMMDEGGA